MGLGKHRELAVLRVRIDLGGGRCRLEREEVAVRAQHALDQGHQRLGQLGAVARAPLLDGERVRAQRPRQAGDEREDVGAAACPMRVVGGGARLRREVRPSAPRVGVRVIG